MIIGKKFIVRILINKLTLIYKTNYNINMKKINKLSSNQPLTLEMLVEYNRKVLFPELEERFVSKKEFTGQMDKVFNRFDILIKNVGDLKEEKDVRKFQRNKDKELYLIIINALKKHEILSNHELKEIRELGIF